MVEIFNYKYGLCIYFVKIYFYFYMYCLISIIIIINIFGIYRILEENFYISVLLMFIGVIWVFFLLIDILYYDYNIVLSFYIIMICFKR